MPYAPQPQSKRSHKRRSRGFKSLEVDSRKHRRASRRLGEKCTWDGTLHVPGFKGDGSLKGGKLKAFMMTSGGSMRFSAT